MSLSEPALDDVILPGGSLVAQMAGAVSYSANVGTTITETIAGVSVTTTISGSTITAVYGAPVDETWVTTISGNSISSVRTA